jgi:RNA polymerase sigma factor (sigma-70 family)
MSSRSSKSVQSSATDAELVDAIVGGNQQAFAVLYDRYADRVYSFCLTLTRDRGLAEDVVSDTFVAAWQNMAALRDRSAVRAFLYRIARNRIARVGAKTARQVPVDPEGPVLASLAAEVDVADGVSGDSDSGARRDESFELVWAAAEGLNENERAVLELSVRQGLQGEELARSLGLTRHNATVLASRMRANLERSISALYLVRQENPRCKEFRQVTTAYEGAFTPVWRKRIGRHIDQCVYCEGRSRSTALSTFAASPLAAAPAELRAKILRRATGLVRAFIAGSRALEAEANESTSG